jgi:DNA-binding Lrp family transcriptional regulator
MVNFDGNGASLTDIASYLGIAERTLRDRVKRMKNEFTLEKGIVRCKETEDPESEP